MLHITPEMCRAGWEYLRTTLPFRRWNMPLAEEVIFVVNNTKGQMAACYIDGKTFEVRVTQHRITTTQSLIETIAHEMCHIRQAMIGQKADTRIHGKKYKALANAVCRIHGFNRDYF